MSPQSWPAEERILCGEGMTEPPALLLFLPGDENKPTEFSPQTSSEALTKTRELVTPLSQMVFLKQT